MKPRLPILAVLVAAALAVPAGALAVPAAALANNAPVYYVALGDSLATGAQPAPPGVRSALLAANGMYPGYVDLLYESARTELPNLQLRNFGCGGEDSQSMIDGGIGFDVRCGYVHGSQLAEAVAFLEAHPGEIAFVTIDIGANDLAPCFAALDFSSACLGTHLPAITTNLATTLAALREATRVDIPIIGMNYYDPFLGLWALGLPDLAIESAAFIVEFNDALEAVYQAAADPVADVETAFAVTDFTIIDSMPLNVTNACTLTWFCSIQDIHATDAGYAVIAQAFEEHLP